MAARTIDYTAHFKADDQLTKAAEEAADALDELEKQGDVEVRFKGDASQIQGDIEDVLGLVDKLEGTDAAKLVLTSNATQITGEIADLVLELNRLDDPHEIDIKVGQIKALETGLGDISTKAQEVVAKTGGIGGAMGNAFGEASEDILGLAGVTGTAQQAIGDLVGDLTNAATSAEGLSGSLGSLAAGGGLAAAALAIGVIKNQLEAAAATDAFNTNRVASFANSLEDASVSAKELSDALSDADKGEGIMVRIGNETTKVDDAVQKTFGTFEKFQAQVDKGTDGYERWTEGQMAAAKAAGLNGAELANLSMAFQDAADGTIEGRSKVDALTIGYYDQVQAATALGAATTGIAAASDEAAFKAQFYGDTLKDIDDSQAKAAQTALEFTQVLSSAEWGQAALTAATAGFTALGEAQFGATNQAVATQSAYDDLNAAIAQNGFTFDVATEAGRANEAQIQNLYSASIPALAKAFDDSDGSLTSFKSNMDALSTQTFQQLQDQTDLTDDQIREVMDRLGAFDGSTYQSTFEMLGAEEASTKLALLSGVLSSLPPDVQRQVTLDIIAGDPQAALDHIATAVGAPGAAGTATVPIVPGEDTATPVIAGIASTDWTTSIAVGGDPAGGKAAVKEVDDTAAKTKPIIDVAANTKAAIATMYLINIIAQAMAPVINVGANTFPAIGAAAAATQLINSMHATVGVTAALRSYPSAGEIAARIGVVRVPIDAYIRTMPRVNGAVPG